MKEYANDIEKEAAFLKWYSQHVKKLGLSPDPYDPLHFYDYKAAWEAGVEPGPNGHWPSEFKLKGHPNLFVGGVDTRSGYLPQKGLLESENVYFNRINKMGFKNW